jgi:hypothetical protein
VEKKPNLAPCDLGEVFSQLERADVITLKQAQIELARIRGRKEQSELQETNPAERPSTTVESPEQSKTEPRHCRS